MFNILVTLICVLTGTYLIFNGGTISEVLGFYIFGGISTIIDKLEKLNEHSK